VNYFGGYSELLSWEEVNAMTSFWVAMTSFWVAMTSFWVESSDVKVAALVQTNQFSPQSEELWRVPSATLV
jgi:hypothetical protein